MDEVTHDAMCSQSTLYLAKECRMCQTINIVRQDERNKTIGAAVWEVTVDPEIQVAYLWMVPEGIYTRTDGLTTHRDAYIDIDASGRVVGIEIHSWPGKLDTQE